MTVLNVVFSIFLLIVITWSAIFGVVGGLLARARGAAFAVGVAWGVVLGPLGWLAIVWTTRASTTGQLVSTPKQESRWLPTGASWDD